MIKALGLSFVILFFYFEFASAQQNSTLFFMQSTPQANFVNPAIRNDCRWLIGLPVLSSVHVNYGNSVFTFHDALKLNNNNYYNFDGDALSSKLGKTNFITSELHLNLFFLGFWIKKNYITFSINEKADLFATYSRDLFNLAWKGNSQFEGQTAELGKTGVFLNYRREYAVGISRKPNPDFTWGIRGKLLFGKLNTTMTGGKANLYTNPQTFALSGYADWGMKTSLPIQVYQNSDSSVNSVSYNGNTKNIIMNRSNLGLAVDLGFIQNLDENITLSGSILDLGFIRWTSTPNTFYQSGNYTYNGIVSDTVNQKNYINDLIQSVQNEFTVNTKSSSYISPLSPMIYFGATYKLKDDLNAGLLLSGKINRYRITSGMTLSLNKAFSPGLSGSLSYSYIYRDFKNIGLGIKAGKSPVQFYAVTDNVLGLIKPLDTKNINLRFGLQFNFGCTSKENTKGCGCGWMREAAQKEARYKKLLKKGS
ncbi:MAG: DUF5723 family protein [Bacteroidota bacterium]|nr:DUF5723 family protein [Bacteroidota bacterium]